MNSYVYIPDPNLKSAINKQLNFNRQPNEDITEAEIQSITNLSEANKNIQDLTGLERAINLTYLDLSNNLICDIVPVMLLPHLSRLDLSNNKINDISPFSSSMLTSLTWLDLSGNQISDITQLNSRMFMNLVGLDLSNNPISVFDLYKLNIVMFYINMINKMQLKAHLIKEL